MQQASPGRPHPERSHHQAALLARGQHTQHSLPSAGAGASWTVPTFAAVRCSRSLCRREHGLLTHLRFVLRRRCAAVHCSSRRCTRHDQLTRWQAVLLRCRAVAGMWSGRRCERGESGAVSGRGNGTRGASRRAAAAIRSKCATAAGMPPARMMALGSRTQPDPRAAYVKPAVQGRHQTMHEWSHDPIAAATHG